MSNYFSLPYNFFCKKNTNNTMFKSQNRGRQVYAALGGRVGILTIIIVAIIVTVLIVMYIRKKIKENQEDQDDFLRYQKLIKNYLKIKRENLNFTEERVQFEMDRFQFTTVLLPIGNAEQNKTWDTDTESFGDLCNSLMGMVSYASDKNSKYYNNALLWKQILFAVRTISGKLPDRPKAFTTPWGTNWYQFSITYPTFLVSTAFSYLEVTGVEDAFLTRHLASYINNYFEESRSVDGLKSMGWLRYESNVVGMSVPVIGGRLYSQRFDGNVNSQKYARDYMSANYVYEGNGFYYDNTYITHVSRNDGYTTSFYNEFVLVFNFYRMDTKFFTILHRTFGITEHPDFPLHHGPWFSRTSSLKGFEPGRKFAHYGLDIRGFERGVCVRTKNISLHYNGQIKPLAAYESDQVNREWGQCWIFMRRALTKNSASKLYAELVPYYDGVHSYGRKQINWVSSTTTTETFEPESTLCSLCYIQDKVAGMYNKFKITMANQYTFDIEEINLVTPKGFHVYYNCKINLSTASSNPYTIACHLGNLDEKQDGRMTGVGANHSYAFDNFIGTFLYLDETDAENDSQTIVMEEVKDPETSNMMNALLFQPTAGPFAKFGFSNNFYEYDSNERHNNLIELPTINTLVAEDYKLEKVDTEDALLFLHDYKNKMSVVSYAFNNTLPRGITIKKNLLDEKFSKYTVEGGIFSSTTNAYTVNTYEKQFQMVLKNVVFK